MRPRQRASARFLTLVVAASLGSARLAKADPDNANGSSNGPSVLLNQPFGDDTPPSAPAAPSDPQLGNGSRGDDVVRLQHILNEDRATRRSTPISEDGDFGPTTLAALKAYQKVNGLEQSGVTDAATWSQLQATDAAFNGTSDDSDSSTGAATTVENLLVSNGSGGSSSQSVSHDPMHLSASALDQLARLIESEAGVCSLQGKIAVGAVVLNRVRAGWGHGTVQGVIAEPGQFDGYGDSAYNSWPSAASRIAALHAAQGEDPSNGATYYYNPYLVRPEWARNMTQTTQIGTNSMNTHRFMKPD